MSKREYRRFTAEQKIEILREADQPGVTVSEVCRRHGLSPSVLYRWRAVAQGGSAVALKRDAQRAPRKDDVETRHKAEIERMRAVIAEITAENLELKKDLKLDDLSRVPAQSKAEVIRIVRQTKQRSGWPAHRTLAALGVPRSVYYGWLRRENLEDRAGAPCRVYEALSEERAAICEFALRYPKIGYRKLTWMMVDAQVVCVGESTVYRVLSEANLLSRWKRSERSSGEYHFRPSAPNQQWHTDVMYVWVAARFCFLLSFVDAFSRYVVHHSLLMTLDGRSVATELQAALEANQGIEPRIVHDHGSEFVNRDVAAVIKAHNLIDIKTRPRHPESNGIVEHFNGTVSSVLLRRPKQAKSPLLVQPFCPSWREARQPWASVARGMTTVVGSPDISAKANRVGHQRQTNPVETVAGRRGTVSAPVTDLVPLRTHFCVQELLSRRSITNQRHRFNIIYIMRNCAHGPAGGCVSSPHGSRLWSHRR